MGMGCTGYGIAEEVNPGQPGEWNGKRLYITFDYWTFMSERDLLLVFLLVNCL